MPGERELCQTLLVSRPTLSKALKTLEREGLLESSAKSRRKIVPEFDTKPKREGPVVLLLPQALETMELHTVLWINRLRMDMSGVPREFSIRVDPRVFSENCEVHLERVTRSMDASCWVIPYTTRAMQHWIVDSKLPFVVVGSCFKGVALHSVDLDFRSVGRHAAGMLLSRGHKFLCMVTTGRVNAGGRLTELGFLDGCRTHSDGGDPGGNRDA
ncbi:GntR family transcriptional regulator [Coraliomargarita parva]|uniref:GntR family transcriptional regulator n=1 Tax=Coraliomargarita parva TaxID=3014050 RepID=UPI0022B32914|nr:GntR family transcriptional regulator [Coraliomargarita parva]